MLSSKSNRIYLGNFHEEQYDFLESIQHIETNNILELIEGAKFGGRTENRYQWLRNPENLWLAYCTFKTSGLENWVSRADYDSAGFTYWGIEWEGNSTRELVKGFLSGYHQTDSNYFTQFWKRRKSEGNAEVCFKIFTDIDDFYSGDRNVYNITSEHIVNFRLLQLIIDNHKYNSNRAKYVLDYFESLKSSGLEYSAFHLIHSPLYSLQDYEQLDSLIKTLNHDTLSFDDYQNCLPERAWIDAEYDYGP